MSTLHIATTWTAHLGVILLNNNKTYPVNVNEVPKNQILSDFFNVEKLIPFPHNNSRFH